MAGTRRPLVAGNWKMNGLRAGGVALAKALAGKVEARGARCDIVLCPPATLLCEVAAALAPAEGRIALGGQDCAPAPSGAFTGDISAPMLADAGARYVILGHSERRAGHGETDAVVRAKAEAALAAGLAPIVCVGEREDERDQGRALEVVGVQLSGSLPPAAGAALVVAYEPVWAIGTGRTPTTGEVGEVHRLVRERLRAMPGIAADAVRVLYGGSVKPGNAAELFAIEGVDGGLVGGASLNVEDFWTICESCGPPG